MFINLFVTFLVYYKSMKIDFFELIVGYEMKKAIIILIFVLSYNLISQAIVEDGKMTITPNWNIGDKKNYNYESQIYIAEDEDIIRDDTSFAEMEFLVAGKSDNGYTIQTRRFLKDTSTSSYKEKFYVDVFHKTKIFYDIDENGDYQNLAQFGLLKSVVKYSMENNWKMFIEDRDFKPGDRKPDKQMIINEINKLMTMGAEQFIKGRMKVGNIFGIYHSGHNNALNMEDTTHFIYEVENPLNAQKYDITVIAKINKLDAIDNIMDVTYTTKGNKKNGFNMAYEVYELMDKQIRDFNDLPETDATEEIRFVIDLASGWILEMEYNKSVKADDYVYKRKRVLKEIKK